MPTMVQLQLVLKLLDVLSMTLVALPDIKARYDAAHAAVTALVNENRNPSREELDALLEDTTLLSEELFWLADKANGGTGQPPPKELVEEPEPVVETEQADETTSAGSDGSGSGSEEDPIKETPAPDAVAEPPATPPAARPPLATPKPKPATAAKTTSRITPAK